MVNLAEEISYYLQKSGASSADSQDIAQDVLVKLLEAEIVLPFEKVRAWLYRSAVRAYIDRYRRDKHYHEILQREFFTPDKFLVYDQEGHEELYQAVASLPDKYRQIIDLYYFQDMTTKEVATVLGKSQSWVKISLYRGRKQLEKLLEERGYSYEDF